MNSKLVEQVMQRMEARACGTTSKNSSLARSRFLSGKYCRVCIGLLPPPHTPGLQYCTLCRPGARRHTVYVSFAFDRLHGWRCEFLEWNLITPAGKSVTFRSPEPLIEMARRGGALTYANSLQKIAYGIKVGWGHFYLRLTDAQYEALQGSLPVADEASDNLPK